LHGAAVRGICRWAMTPPLFRLYLAASVDGFIATPDGGVDWLEPYPAEDFGFDAFLPTIGTIVMGRTTYEQALRLGPWSFEGKHTIVLTSRPIDEPPAGVERWDGDVTALALLGDGIPLFERSDRSVALRLEEVKAHRKGVVQVVYAMAR
jgi:dihydrofolate reductase